LNGGYVKNFGEIREDRMFLEGDTDAREVFRQCF
jgi:hypothetical protein